MDKTTPVSRLWKFELGDRYASVGILLFYFITYFLLDWVSFFYAPSEIDITPWNPPVAASLILILLKGPRWAPALWLASFFSQTMLESHNTYVLHGAVSLSETISYTTAGWLLRGRFSIDTSLSHLEDVIRLCTVSTIAAGAMALAYVLSYHFFGAVSLGSVPAYVLQYWCGDALGILIVIPVCLTLRSAPNLRAEMRKLISVRLVVELLLCAGIAGAAMVARAHDIHVFYLLIFPAIWVAVVGSFIEMPLTILCILLTSLFFCQRLNIDASFSIYFLPFFMLSLTWIGLTLSALTGERELSRLQIIKGNARLRALLDMYPDCMLIVDIANHIVAANRNFARLYGMPVERIIGQPIANIMPAFHHGLNGELPLQLKDHSFIPTDVSTAKVHVGEKFSSILTIRDLTSRKQAETEQRQRRAISEQATRTHLTGGLAAALAHELNQPLSAIMSYVNACQKILRVCLRRLA